MIATLPELANPFTNARIVSANTDPDRYHAHQLHASAARGQNAYVMSRSALMHFQSCPMRWRDGYDPPQTDATEWGTAMDCLFLQPESWDARFAVTPDKYKDEKTGELKKWNGNANVCKAWKAGHAGKQILSTEEHESALIACARLFGDEFISDITFKAERQVFILAEYHDADTDMTVPFKVLVDLVPHADGLYGKALADFKTARSAAHGQWTREVSAHGYHIQAACYLDAYVAATGEDRIEFRHIISEKLPPYQTARRLLSVEFIQLGRATYVDALKRYCQCLSTNDWPDYECGPDAIEGWTLVQPEAWMLK